MKNFIGIAFWIGTFFIGLPTKSIPIHDFKINYLRTNVSCPESTFYTPKNVKKECILEALDCVMTELKGTATEECSDPEEYIDSAVEALEYWIKNKTSKKTSECACEKWTETTFSEFLDAMKSLLELYNTVSA